MRLCVVSTRVRAAAVLMAAPRPRTASNACHTPAQCLTRVCPASPPVLLQRAHDKSAVARATTQPCAHALAHAHAQKVVLEAHNTPPGRLQATLDLLHGAGGFERVTVVQDDALRGSALYNVYATRPR